MWLSSASPIAVANEASAADKVDCHSIVKNDAAEYRKSEL
jgi:hypothetical protein